MHNYQSSSPGGWGKYLHFSLWGFNCESCTHPQDNHFNLVFPKQNAISALRDREVAFRFPPVDLQVQFSIHLSRCCSAVEFLFRRGFMGKGLFVLFLFLWDYLDEQRSPTFMPKCRYELQIGIHTKQDTYATTLFLLRAHCCFQWFSGNHVDLWTKWNTSPATVDLSLNIKVCMTTYQNLVLWSSGHHSSW